MVEETKPTQVVNEGATQEVAQQSEAQAAEEQERFDTEYVRKLRAEAAEYRKRLRELESKVKADEEAKLTEQERLQKRLAELERIIQASSNPGDLVLDPFCGCGTAVHAAQKLGREWIGIDITHLAISLIEKRMRDAFPGIQFEVYGTPKDLDGARELARRDKYQFQWWACSLVNAQPYQGKKKGADSGIDGVIYFQDDETGAKKIIVSVKGGEHVTVGMVKDLIATVEREKAAIGLFVTLAEPTKALLTEAVSAGFYQSPKGDVPRIQVLTVEDLLAGKARPQFYDLALGGHTFKKARVEKRKAKQDKLF